MTGAKTTTERIDLVRAWLDEIIQMDDARLSSPEPCRWPIQERPFSEMVAWANVELMKNAAEIGLVRFLHAVRS